MPAQLLPHIADMGPGIWLQDLVLCVKMGEGLVGEAATRGESVCSQQTTGKQIMPAFESVLGIQHARSCLIQPIRHDLLPELGWCSLAVTCQCVLAVSQDSSRVTCWRTLAVKSLRCQDSDGILLDVQLT